MRSATIWTAGSILLAAALMGCSSEAKFDGSWVLVEFYDNYEVLEDVTGSAQIDEDAMTVSMDWERSVTVDDVTTTTSAELSGPAERLDTVTLGVKTEGTLTITETGSDPNVLQAETQDWWCSSIEDGRMDCLEVTDGETAGSADIAFEREE